MGPLRRVKLTQLNTHLQCVLCRGYFVDATTIIECLHTFCKTCIVRYLQTSSFCPTCDVQVHKTKPLLSLREDRTLQDVVFKLVPGLFHSEMKRRFYFYKEHPEGGGDKTEQSLRERRHFFHVDDQISLSLEHVLAPPCPTQSLVHPHLVKPLKVSNGQQHKSTVQEEKNEPVSVKEEEGEGGDGGDSKLAHKRYLRCPAAIQVSHLEKFVRLKYNLSPKTHRVEMMHGGDCLMGELTLLDVVYMYKWTEDAPLRLMYTVSVLPQSRKRAKPTGNRAGVKTESGAPPCKVAKLQPSPSDSKVAPPPVSTPWQDSTKGDVVARGDGKDEKPHDAGKVLPPQAVVADKSNITTSTASVSASLCTETKPSSSVTQTSIMSCGSGAVQLPTARGRPALTTTTSATTTPRVAVSHMSLQTPPTTVPLPVVGPNSPAAVAPAFSTKSPFSPAMTSAPAGKIQTSHPVVNGLNDCGSKQVRGTGPNLHGNRMPQPIISTRPRLGRPPNPSKVNAVKMRPPAPRMSMARPPGKKVYPGGMVTRPNTVASASLNVQNRLSSISGPPANLAASKASVNKSSDDLLQDDRTSPLQTPPVSTINSSTSSVNITTTLTSSTTFSNATHGAPSAQPPSPSQVSTSKGSTNMISAVPATKTTVSPHQGTLAMDRQAQKQCLPQTQGDAGGQRTNQQSPRPPLNPPSFRPAAPQVSRHPGPQMGQRQSSQRTHNPPSHRHLMQANQRPALHHQTQGNQQPSSHVMQHLTSLESSQSLTGLIGAGSPPGLGAQKFPLSSTNQRLSNLCAQRPHLGPGPQRPTTPVSTRPANSPAPHRPPSSPAPHRPSNSPAPHRPPSSPAPHRLPGSPAPHRLANSPAPHRQAGSTTPRPHSTPTPPSSVASPSPRSTPSPRCASSPSPAAVSAPAAVRDALPPLIVSSPASSVAPSGSANTANVTTPQGSKPSETNNYSRVAPPSGTGTNQTPPSKTVSPNGGKTAPKSPGRGRGASSSPSILSIAQSLANRHLQQRTTTTTTVSPTNTTMNSMNIGTTQINPHQAYTTANTTPVYPGPVASSLVPLAAAYMASAYGDTTPDVTAMRNLITLSQTAACIRELNLAAMVKSLPRPNDPAPIDLSPTSKAAPPTPLTNGKLSVSSSSSTTATKTTNSKSPTKNCRPSTTANAPTISPPTPEVTITKLPNTPASTTPSTTPTSSTAKNTFGSVKLGSSNTNTVSITKRPSSNKIAITKSPANASVRQIPNPSFVRHQSEARNNNNVSKPPSSSGSHAVSATTTSITKNVSNKHSGGGGRAAGNSPLKETGPLPKTSSIMEIENLTRSLAAPAAAAAAAASHGFNFFDNR